MKINTSLPFRNEADQSFITNKKLGCYFFVVFLLLISSAGKSANEEGKQPSFLDVQTILAGWQGNVVPDNLRIEFKKNVIEMTGVEDQQRVVTETHAEFVYDRERYYERVAYGDAVFDEIETCSLFSFDGNRSYRFSPEIKTGFVEPGLSKTHTVRPQYEAFFLVSEKGIPGQHRNKKDQEGVSRFEEMLLDANAKVEPYMGRVSGELCHVVTIVNPEHPAMQSKLWIAHEKGMYPVQYRRYRNGEMEHELTVEGLASASGRLGDIWYPTAIRRFLQVQASEGVMMGIKDRMEILRYVPDSTIEDAFFRLQFPQGTRVGDLVAEVEYIVGGDTQIMQPSPPSEADPPPALLENDATDSDVASHSHSAETSDTPNDTSLASSGRSNRYLVGIVLISALLVIALAWHVYFRKERQAK